MLKQSIPIGLKSGVKVTVFDLDKDDYGLRCKCTCPDCGFPLVAVTGNRYRSAHFKHKAGNWHCHFNFDEEVRDYVYDKLLALKQFNSSKEDLEYINVISKHNPQIEVSPKFVQQRQIEVLEKKEGKLRVRIDDVDFWVKLVFKHNEKDSNDKTIIISLPELIRLNNLDEKEINYIRALINLKCNEKLIVHEKQLARTKSELSNKLQKPIINQPKNVPFNMIDVQSKIHDSKPDFYSCPYCKEKLTIQLNSRSDVPFFVCSNSNCDFRDTKIFDKVNGKNILAKEVYFKMTHFSK